MASRPPSRARRRRPQGLLRWLGLAAVVLIGLLYYQPVRTYLETRDAVAQRAAEVRALARERRVLQQRLERSTSPEALLREARRLGFVKPGEKLFIVKGIDAWRRSMRRSG